MRQQFLRDRCSNMQNANYRKHNDRTHNSSTYHKKDGTPTRHLLKQEAKEEAQDIAQNVIVSIYDDLNAMHMKLRGISSSDQELTSEYWELEEEFKKLLNSAVNVDLVIGLNKQQLLHVISMCSSYRPFAPHVMLSILTASSRLFEETESEQGS